MAGLVGKYYIEKLARIPVEIDIASEFRYRDPIIDEHTLTIVISQSGETSDTLAALKESKRPGAKTLAIYKRSRFFYCPRSRSGRLYLCRSGNRRGFNEAYTTQLIVMLLLSLYISQLTGTLTPERIKELIDGVRTIPEQMHVILDHVDPIKVFATNYGNCEDAFFLGRSP